MEEKRWKPENGEMYWYVWNDGNACWGNFTGASDEKRFKSGNCFKTEAEAKAAAEKVKALLLSLHSEPVTDCNQLPKLTAEVFDRPAEDALKAEITRYRRALHNLKEDCTRRKHFAVSDEELFLYETISHIEAELDFNIASGERGRK